MNSLLTPLKKLFSPPVFADDMDKTGKAALLHTLLLSFTGVILVVILT